MVPFCISVSTGSTISLSSAPGLRLGARFDEVEEKNGQEKQEEVQRRLDVKFKTSNDSLRKEDQQFYNYGTAIEREKQLIDKRRTIEAKI